MDRSTLRQVLLAGLVLCWPGVSSAQVSDAPYAVRGGRVTFGGDLSLAVAPPDHDAFFNYTSYDQDALRMLRARLTGEWRLTGVLSLVGELRIQNDERPDLAAAFVRWRPWPLRTVTVQAGRIPPVVGAFSRRAYSRDNPVFGVPLAYQYLTSLRPDALPATVEDLLNMRARGWRPSYAIGGTSIATGLPLVSSAAWDTGVEVSWQPSWLELAAAVTRGSPAEPVVRETNSGLQWSGRAAARLPGGLVVGVSGARAPWLHDGVLALVPAAGPGPFSQRLLGLDAEAGAGRWLVRGEWLQSAFELPIALATPVAQRVGAWSGLVEARFRPHPRWQVGARLERIDFSRVQGASGRNAPWDAPVTRAESTLALRINRHVETRAGWQQNWRSGGRVRQRGFPVAGFSYWF